MKRFCCALAIAAVACASAAAEAAWCPGSTGDHANEVPRYEHIFVIIAENHGYAQIIGNRNAPNLVDQLEERHLTWKGYYEGIPAPGSKAVFYPDDHHPVAGQPTELYAAKHNGFMQFRAVQDDLALATKIVGFDQLDRDLASGQVPT